MRVHLIRPMSADLQTLAIADALVTKAGVQMETRTIGSGGADVLMPMSVLHLRRARVSADVVHAMGGRALAVAIMGTNLPIVYTPIGFATPREISWLRAAMRYRAIQVSATSETAARAYLQRGVAPEFVRMIPPGVNPADLSPAGPRRDALRDAKMRKHLGFAEDDKIILLPLELTPTSGYGLSMWSVSLLHALDARYKLLFFGQGRSLESAERLRGRLINPDLLHIAHRRNHLPHLFAAADVLLISNTRPIPTYPIALSLASGIPIVATTTRITSELLEDRRNALLVRDASPKHLALRVLDVMNDASLRWKITDTARADAYEHYSQSRMVETYVRLYEEAARGGSARASSAHAGSTQAGGAPAGEVRV